MTRKEYRARKGERTRGPYFNSYLQSIWKHTGDMCNVVRTKGLEKTFLRTFALLKFRVVERFARFIYTSARSPPMQRFIRYGDAPWRHITHATWLRMGALCFKLVLFIESRLNFWRGKWDLCSNAEPENRSALHETFVRASRHVTLYSTNVCKRFWNFLFWETMFTFGSRGISLRNNFRYYVKNSVVCVCVCVVFIEILSLTHVM